MIIQRLFSRHTPKNLIKYKNYDDEDFEKMSRGDKLRALDLEDSTANKNTSKYIIKKIKKHGSIGAGAGALIGAGLTGKGNRAAGAVLGGLNGGLVGLMTGTLRGDYIAGKEGHNRDKRTLALARKIDRYEKSKGRDDDFEIRTRDKIAARKAMEAARDAQATADLAYIRTI